MRFGLNGGKIICLAPLVCITHTLGPNQSTKVQCGKLHFDGSITLVEKREKGK